MSNESRGFRTDVAGNGTRDSLSRQTHLVHLLLTHDAFDTRTINRLALGMHRVTVALGQSLVTEDVQHYTFPTLTSFLDAKDDLLRAAGVSLGKLMTLRRVSEALATDTLDETMLEQQTSPDAAATLCRIEGIGPWTAAVILLRGLGRLDVFPMNDTSVKRTLALVSGSGAVDVGKTLHALSPQQGMLYYHLLLACLEA